MRFLAELPRYLTSLGLSLSDGQLVQLEDFCGQMTADPLYRSVSKISDPGEIVTKHLLDSLAPLALDLPCWNSFRSPDFSHGKRLERLVDLGTGGGFPAIPLAVVFPECEVWAVDAKGKAVEFVRRMKDGLDLGNLNPRLARAEELGREAGARESFDLVVCRALAGVRVLLEYCLPLVRIGGHVLLYKGPNLDIELAEAQGALPALDVRPDELHTFVLTPPRLPFERGYVLIKKVRPTPAAYPRRNGVPASKPL